MTKIEMEFYRTLISNMRKQTELYNAILEELKKINQNLDGLRWRKM